MATFSQLKTRFNDWMGLVDASTQETSRVEEVLNASISLVLSEGVPGLQQTMSGYTYGDLSVTIESHSANSADVVFTNGSGNLTGVFPNDIFVDANGNEYIIHEVVSGNRSDGTSTTAINLGIPVTSALSGACTIKRRSLELPHNGQVITVANANGYSLDYSPLVPAEGTYDKRRAGAYTVSYSSKLEKSFVTIYPTPTGSTQFTVIQNRATADDSNYDVPDDQIYPVMMRAINLWRVINDEQNAVVAGLTQTAKADAEDLTRTNPGAAGIMVR